MNELNIYTIDDFHHHAHLHGFPKVQIRGFGRIHELALQVLLGKTSPYMKDNRQAIHTYLSRYIEI